MTDDDLRQGLGRALRDARTGARLSQGKLQEKTGVHRNYIGGMERGERTPTIATINLLANALDIEIDELFVEAAKERDA